MRCGAPTSTAYGLQRYKASNWAVTDKTAYSIGQTSGRRMTGPPPFITGEYTIPPMGA